MHLAIVDLLDDVLFVLHKRHKSNRRHPYGYMGFGISMIILSIWLLCHSCAGEWYTITQIDTNAKSVQLRESNTVHKAVWKVPPYLTDKQFKKCLKIYDKKGKAGIVKLKFK